MYTIINKTKRTRTIVKGYFPDLDKELNEGDKIIIISTYSNVIKVPYSVIDNGITYWEWHDFELS